MQPKIEDRERRAPIFVRFALVHACTRECARSGYAIILVASFASNPRSCIAFDFDSFSPPPSFSFSLFLPFVCDEPVLFQMSMLSKTHVHAPRANKQIDYSRIASLETIRTLLGNRHSLCLVFFPIFPMQREAPQIKGELKKCLVDIISELKLRPPT